MGHKSKCSYIGMLRRQFSRRVSYKFYVEMGLKCQEARKFLPKAKFRQIRYQTFCITTVKIPNIFQNFFCKVQYLDPTLFKTLPHLLTRGQDRERSSSSCC